MISEFDKARFWSKIDVGSQAECWAWKPNVGAAGYGTFRMGERVRSAHRVAFEIFNGQIPEGDGYHGTVIMHICDNRRCCNPFHMKTGTNAENSADRDEKGRGKLPPRISLPPELEAVIASDQRSYRCIAMEHGIAISTISRVKNRQSKNVT